MPDEKKTEAEINADAIAQEEATQQTPRGNVHSEADEHAPDLDAPPPLPN